MAETKTESKPKRKKGAKAVAKEYFEAVAAQNVDKMMSMWEPGGKGSIYGMVELEVPGTYSAWFQNLFNAFPGFAFDTLDIVSEWNRLLVAVDRLHERLESAERGVRNAE